MTQQQLADALGLKRATVSMWETVATSPRIGTLRPLAQAHGCTVDDLQVPEQDSA